MPQVVTKPALRYDSSMAEPAGVLPDDPETLRCPDAAQWARMSGDQQRDFVESAYEFLRQERLASPVGRRHKATCARLYRTLHEHCRRILRRLYLADDLGVLYPGERFFAPDLMAVRDVEDLGEDEPRNVWDVTVERRGLDLALEVVVSGSRRKDLYENVSFYAHLGIAEYFV